MDAEAMTDQGLDRKTVLEVLTRLERNEHKRWQMSPAPRVSSRAFGQGGEGHLHLDMIGETDLTMGSKAK